MGGSATFDRTPPPSDSKFTFGSNVIPPVPLEKTIPPSHQLSLSLRSQVTYSVAMELTAKERFDLIRENLAEVLNPEIIEGILAEGRNPRIYWGESI